MCFFEWQVWFKHDLRLDDHPGLAAALERDSKGGGGGVVAAFVFDEALYAHLLATPSGVDGENVLAARIKATGVQLLL